MLTKDGGGEVLEKVFGCFWCVMVFRLDLVTIVFVLKVLGNDIGSVRVASPVPVVQACGNQTHVDPTVPIRSMHLFYVLETLNNQITCSKHTHMHIYVYIELSFIDDI